MKNNIILPNFEDFSPVFSKHMINHLENNLDKKNCILISNLLTIDYINRLKAEPPLSKYIATCINRLKKHLQDKIILNNNFSTIMTLFVVAITEESSDNDIHSSEKAQDALIDSTISELFSDLTSEEYKAIKSFIKKMINGNPKKVTSILNLVKSEPNRLKEIIASALNKNLEPKKIPDFVEQNLEKYISESNSLDKKRNRVHNFFSKLAFTSGALLTASLGMFVGGMILPALIIPSIIITIKTAPLIAEKLSDIVIDKNNNSNHQHERLDYTKESNLTKDVSKTLIHNISRDNIKNIVKNVTIKPHKEAIPQAKTQVEKIKSKEISKDRSI